MSPCKLFLGAVDCQMKNADDEVGVKMTHCAIVQASAQSLTDLSGSLGNK